MENELQKVIDAEEDFICIIKLMNDNVFGEDILGKRDKATGEDLILWVFTKWEWKESERKAWNYKEFLTFASTKKI